MPIAYLNLNIMYAPLTWDDVRWPPDVVVPELPPFPSSWGVRRLHGSGLPRRFAIGEGLCMSMDGVPFRPTLSPFLHPMDVQCNGPSGLKRPHTITD